MKEITKQQYIVGVVNSVAKKYPELRQKSKPCTFALQYHGTAYTLHRRGGLPMKLAKEIETAFHELYKVSDEFNEKNKEFMQKHGYVECAFGLKLRTPIISKCILGSSKTPYAAIKEARSANNAITQSWGMLLNRAIIATDRRIEAAGYGEHILPINMIHDAEYFLVKDDPKYVHFLNTVLIEEMLWNEDPLIKSADVPMCSTMEIGKSWFKLTELKNNASVEEIEKVLEKIREVD